MPLAKNFAKLLTIIKRINAINNENINLFKMLLKLTVFKPFSNISHVEEMMGIDILAVDKFWE